METAQLVDVALGALERLGRMPSVPFYEAAGAAYVRRFCEESGLQVMTDRYGNVLASRAGEDPAAPGVAFVAHLDHPGFEVVSRDGGDVTARALGRLPEGAFEPATPVVFLAGDGRRLRGEVLRRVEAPGPTAVLLKTNKSGVGPLPCAAVLDLADFQLDGDIIRMRALDDLAGCASTLAALRFAVGAPSPGTVYGLFTRAEEAGLVGATLAARETLLPKNTRVVSVECSHALPGAAIGSGPVVRTGDRMTTFDDGAEAYLRAAAARLRARPGGFQSQRQLMSGGVCEASAFAAHGYLVTGIAYPLGNYHNGLYQGTLAAEYIHMNDFAGGVRLLAETVKLAGTDPVAERDWMGRRTEKYAERLRQSAP